MTLEDLINWQKGGAKARVRLGAGASPDMVDTLASKLAGVRGVVPDVSHYDDEEYGMRVKYTGDDEEGTPIYEIGQRPGARASELGPGAPRHAGYKKLDDVMGRISDWGASRPQAKLEPTVQVMPSQDLRKTLLTRLGMAPRFDREGASRRGLESALVAAGLSALGGGDGLAVGSALRGAARGTGRALAGRFGDEVRDWQNGVRADSEAVRLDDSRVAALNRTAGAMFGQDRDAARLELDNWRAAGAPLQRELAAAVAELRGQQADTREENDQDELEARRGEREKKALGDANDYTVRLFSDLIKSKRLAPKAETELIDRIGVIRDYEKKGMAVPDWVYEIDESSIAAMSPEEKKRLDQRDDALVQGGRRLKIQEKNAATAAKNAATSEASLRERERHNRKQEARPVGGSRAVVDPELGPKATPLQKYQYLEKNKAQLTEQFRESQWVLKRLDTIRKSDPDNFGQEDAIRLNQALADVNRLSDYMLSMTKQMTEIEAQYPEMKTRRAARAAAKSPAAPAKKSSAPAKKPAIPKTEFRDIPGIGRVKVER